MNSNEDYTNQNWNELTVNKIYSSVDINKWRGKEVIPSRDNQMINAISLQIR